MSVGCLNVLRRRLSYVVASAGGGGTVVEVGVVSLAGTGAVEADADGEGVMSGGTIGVDVGEGVGVACDFAFGAVGIPPGGDLFCGT